MVSTDWLLIALLKHCIVIPAQKSCINASAVAVFVEWWIVVFVDIVSFHRGICTLCDSLTRDLYHEYYYLGGAGYWSRETSSIADW